MVAPQNPNPPRKRRVHLLRFVMLIVLAVLALPLIVYGVFLPAILPTPGHARWN
jgi:hypothetical protein